MGVVMRVRSAFFRCIWAQKAKNATVSTTQIRKSGAMIYLRVILRSLFADIAPSLSDEAPALRDRTGKTLTYRCD